MKFTYLLLLSTLFIAYSCESDSSTEMPGVAPTISSISIESPDKDGNLPIYDIDLDEIDILFSVPIKINEDIKITLGDIPVTLLAQDKSLKISFKDLKYGTKYTLQIPKGSIVNKDSDDPIADYSISFSTEVQGVAPKISYISIESPDNDDNLPIYGIDLGEIDISFSVLIKINKDIKITLGDIPVTLLAQDNSLKISFNDLKYGTKYTLKIPKGSIVNKDTDDPMADYSISFSTEVQGVVPAISSISIESPDNDDNLPTYGIDLGEIDILFSVPIKINENKKITLGDIPVTLLAQDKSLKISFKDLKYGRKYTLQIPKGSIVNKDSDDPMADYSISFFTEVQDIIGPKISHLSVNGRYLVNSLGEKVVLKGVSYGWHNWWPRFFNAGTVNTFATDWNCSVVRASMGVEPWGAYLYEPQKGIDCVTTVVDAAIEEGIYAIIDWHSHDIHEAEAKEFFRQMATRYKGSPNVIYEIFNEPATNGPLGFNGTYLKWDAIKAYAIEVIKVIKAIDSNAVIIVGTPFWAQHVDKVADDPITGYSNILYTLHFYAGAHDQSLRTRADKAIAKNLPLFITECAGMDADGDGDIDHAEWAVWLAWMEENSLSWVTWSIADKDETCSMLKSTASSTGNWPDSQIKEWGLVVKEELKKK